MAEDTIIYKYTQYPGDKYWTVRRSIEKDIAFTSNEHFAIVLIEDLKLADGARKKNVLLYGCEVKK